jgi:hypothetical protein
MEEQVMESQRFFQYMLVAAALTVTAATTAQPVLAAEKTIAEDFAVTNNPAEDYPETANIAVDSANAVINHLRKVEVLLNNGAVARARSVLTSSRDYFRSLQYMKEEAEYALHHINNSNEMNDNDVSVLPRDWDGIYSSLDEMEVYAPEVAEKARESLKQSERHATTCDIQRTAERHVIEVQVYLGDLDPEAVRVELYADGIDGSAPERVAMQRVRQLVGANNGYAYHAEVPATRQATDYTARLISHRDGVALPLEAAHILWQR